MKIPVDINVRYERTGFEDYRNAADIKEPQRSENSYKGMMTVSKKGLRVEYTEKGALALDSTKTIVSAFGDIISINRVGELNTNLVFEEGKSCDCVCETGYMPMSLRVYTKALKNGLSSEGGKLEVDYTIEIVGNLAERNKLCLSVAPSNCAS